MSTKPSKSVDAEAMNEFDLNISEDSVSKRSSYALCKHGNDIFLTRTFPFRAIFRS